jgi:hypothetical protein
MYTPPKPIFDETVDLDAPLEEAGGAFAQVMTLMTELNDAEIVMVRLNAEARVPRVTAAEVDLTAETVEQYANAKALMAVTLSGNFASPSQKSTTMRAVTTALRALVDLQTRAHNADTVKQLEQALMLTLRDYENAEELIAAFQEKFQRISGRQACE